MSDSLETFVLVPLEKAAAIKLIRKWREHRYPESQYEAGLNNAREQCATELLTAITPELNFRRKESDKSGISTTGDDAKP